MATIAIGDVHGNLSALVDLLATLQPLLCAKDELVFLGDYIDKGPNTRGCIDRIMAFRNEAACRVITLLGNHEYEMLRTWKDWRSHSWIWIGGFETIESYSLSAAEQISAEFAAAGPRIVTEKAPVNYGVFFDVLPAPHVEFFTNLQLYHETPEVICTHAGIDPRQERLQDIDPQVWVWGTERFPTLYQGERNVVYGHWDNSVDDVNGRPLPLRLGNRTFGIDTISKGILTAMRFPGEKIFQSRRSPVD